MSKNTEEERVDLSKLAEANPDNIIPEEETSAADFRTDPLLFALADEGYITELQAQELMEEHERSGKTPRDLLVDQEYMEEGSLLEVIAGQLGTSVLDIEHYEIDAETITAIPGSMARMYNVIVVEDTPSSMVLATYELVPLEIGDEIGFALGKDVSFVVGAKDAIRAFIEKNYGEDADSVAGILDDMALGLDSAGEGEVKSGMLNVDDMLEQADAAPVVRFVNLVLYQAVQERASDIHFEPFEKDFKIRIRVDGALYEMAPPPRHLAVPIISRVKVISGLDIAETRLPQDGRIEMVIKQRPVDFRVSTLPTAFGESVVLRVLDRSALGLKLENIGLPKIVFDEFIIDIEKPNGIIIITGPTGSGKTTCLYSALQKVNKVEDKILTAEDPVEYDLDGIVQVQVDERAGSTFAKALRAFLRQDPDIVMVGEIRDLTTCRIAIQASLTGHLVFSTLHTNDAAGAVTRLVDMGIEPFLIASSVEAIMGTRLLRKICSECKTPFTPNDDQLKSIGLRREDVGDQVFYTGNGCETCNQTGYKGRRGLFEYLRASDPIRELINERAPTLEINNKARELGMRTLREDGIRCILDGYTTIEEVLKYT